MPNIEQGKKSLLQIIINKGDGQMTQGGSANFNKRAERIPLPLSKA